MSYLNLGSRNTVSVDNSTVTPLNTLAVFTGTSEDVLRYNSVYVSAKTDQIGILSIQFSTDGVNWDDQLSYNFRLTSGYAVSHKIPVARRYVRVVVTNTSASNQTYLRVGTIFSSSSESMIIPGNSIIQKEADTRPVRVLDPKLEIAAGLREGIMVFSVTGRNLDIDIGSETVWGPGGTWSPQVVARTLSCVSSDANDSAAGTGARTITISGVNAARELTSETVTLNGVTPVVTTNTWLGVNVVIVATAGSTLGNVGNITLTSTTDGFIQGYIVAGDGASAQAIYHVPVGYDVYIGRVNTVVDKVSGGGTQPKVYVDIWVVGPNGVKFIAGRDVFEPLVRDGQDVILSNYTKVSAGSYMWMQATTDVNNTYVRTRIEGIRVQQ